MPSIVQFCQTPASHPPSPRCLMRRIGLAVVLTLSLALGPLLVEGQQRAMPRVGAISGTTREQTEGSPVDLAFREGLRNLGYIEGRNVAIEWRYADGKAERFQEIAEDLVRLGVDVVVAANQA